jgi:hypothetical protein
MPDITIITEKEWNEGARCVCCWATDAAATGPEGVVLHRIGAVIENLTADLGHDMETLDLRRDDTPAGISVWEGIVSPEGEDEFKLEGCFRSLTDAEWSCVRANVSPWAVEGSPERSGSAGTCLRCPHHEVIPDPDPHDWFNDDDVAVVCNLAPNPDRDPKSSRYSVRQGRRCVASSCRPTRTRLLEESAIPSWCPLPTVKEKS